MPENRLVMSSQWRKYCVFSLSHHREETDDGGIVMTGDIINVVSMTAYDVLAWLSYIVIMLPSTAAMENDIYHLAASLKICSSRRVFITPRISCLAGGSNGNIGVKMSAISAENVYKHRPSRLGVAAAWRLSASLAWKAAFKYSGVMAAWRSLNGEGGVTRHQWYICGVASVIILIDENLAAYHQ